MFRVINLKDWSSKNINRLARWFRKNGYDAKELRKMHKLGFNPKFNILRQLTGWQCRTCHKDYKSATWAAKHRH